MTTANRKSGPAQPLAITLTINLTNGDEIETEGSCATLQDLGSAVQALVDDPATGIEKHERWSSLVVVAS